MQTENSIPVPSNTRPNRETLLVVFLEEQRLIALNAALDAVLGQTNTNPTFQTEGAGRCPQCGEANRFGEMCGECARKMDAGFYEERSGND